MPKKRFDPVDVAVGNRIRVQRLLSDMSQSALGDAIGVTFQQVQKYEKGANRVGASRLTQIAKALGVPIKTFFDGSDENDSSQQAGTAFEFLAVPGALELVQAYAQIHDNKLRRSLVALVQDMAGDTDEAAANSKNAGR
jgi:transcriptional regulator with XRE-family HTH domain